MSNSRVVKRDNSSSTCIWEGKKCASAADIRGFIPCCEDGRAMATPESLVDGVLSLDEHLDTLVEAAQQNGPSAALSDDTLSALITRRAWQSHRRYELFAAYDAGRIPAIAVLEHLGIAADEQATDQTGILAEGRHRAVTSADTAYDDADTLYLEELDDLNPGDDIAPLINANQGKCIVVPPETYRADGTITVGDDTTLIFDGSVLDTPNGKHYNLFDCGGSGWHVGGDITVDQSGAFPWIRLAGSGQFGDANGRLSFVGECPDEVIGLKRVKTTKWLTMKGEPGDAITLKNIDQHQAPPYNECSDVGFTWTRYPGVVTVVGCHLGNFHDNGFYYKAMRGSIGIYDTFFDNMNVAALRHGCDHGAELKRCLVLDDGNYNPARTAGRTCRGVNHSVVSFQDKNGVLGDVHLEEVYYQKGDDPQGGEFLRDMLSNSGIPDTCVASVKNCQWPSYPEFGSASDTKWVIVEDQGGNGGDPSAAKQQPYPLGGGPSAFEK